MVKSKTGYLSNSLYLLVRVIFPNHFFFEVMDICNFIFCLNNSVSSARKISKQTQHYIPNSEFSIVACSPPLVV